MNESWARKILLTAALWLGGFALIALYERTIFGTIGAVLALAAYGTTGWHIIEYGWQLTKPDMANVPRNTRIAVTFWIALPFALLVTASEEGLSLFVTIYHYADTHGWYVAFMLGLFAVAFKAARAGLTTARRKIATIVAIQPAWFLFFSHIVKRPVHDAYFVGTLVAVYGGVLIALAMGSASRSRANDLEQP